MPPSGIPFWRKNDNISSLITKATETASITMGHRLIRDKTPFKHTTRQPPSPAADSRS